MRPPSLTRRLASAPWTTPTAPPAHSPGSSAVSANATPRVRKQRQPGLAASHHARQLLSNRRQPLQRRSRHQDGGADYGRVDTLEVSSSSASSQR